MTTLSIFDAAGDTPRGLAIVDGERHIDFQELAERVWVRLRGLAILADGDDISTSLVAVQTDEGLPTLEVILALLELGRTFLPLHPRLTASEREQLLTRLPVTWCIAPNGDGQRLEPRHPCHTDPGDALLRSAPQLAALTTSGSSGAPRVALLSRRAFLAAAEASAANLGWHADDRWLLCLPVAHVGGLSVVTRCLLARRPIVLVPSRRGSSSIESVALAIDQGRPSLMSLVPTQLHALLERQPEFEMPSCVRAVLTGGAAASPRLLGASADRGWPVITSYGLTEACSQVTTQRPGTINRGELGAGSPLPGVQVRLDGGVICVSGPTLFSGYLGGLPGEATSTTEFRTRDLGRFDEVGNLHVLGRVDDLIISGGENVVPREVEAVLESCPGVLEACVFGVPDPRWGEIVAAGLRTAGEADEQLIEAVNAESHRRLSEFRRPKLYVCTSRFPLGATGKLDRREAARELMPLLRSAPRQSEP